MNAEIKGIDSLLSKLNALHTGIKDGLLQGVTEVARIGRVLAQVNASTSKHSQADSDGTVSLRQSIRDEAKQTDDGAEGRVFTGAPHAKYVEFGTGAPGAASGGKSPHVSVIYTPKPGWVYPTVIDGEETFRFTHGMPARPYLYPTAVALKGVAQQIIAEKVAKAVHEVVQK